MAWAADVRVPEIANIPLLHTGSDDQSDRDDSGQGMLIEFPALLMGIKAAYSLLLTIILIAGCIEMIVVFVATTGIAFVSHKHGLDPGDVVIPIITSIGDIVGVASVFAAVWIVW